MFRIYRRQFNPPEGQKNLKRLVATFQPIAETEAYRCLEYFQGLATSMKENPFFSEYRYTIERDAEKPMAASEAEGVQVDLTKATPTKRPISFNYSYHVETDGQCTCIAYHMRYGSIRGSVENSPQGRKLFIARVQTVWPNSDMTNK